MSTNLEIYNKKLNTSQTLSDETGKKHRIYFGRTFDGKKGYLSIDDNYYYLSLEDGEFESDSDRLNELLTLIDNDTSDSRNVIELIEQILGVAKQVKTTLQVNQVPDSDIAHSQPGIKFGDFTERQNLSLNRLLRENPRAQRINERDLSGILSVGKMRILAIHNISVKLFPQEITDNKGIESAKELLMTGRSMGTQYLAIPKDIPTLFERFFGECLNSN